MIKKIFYGLLVVGMVILLSSAVLAGEQDERSLPVGVEALKLDSPVQVSGSLDHSRCSYECLTTLWPKYTQSSLRRAM
jgi:hypothetical protein